jgi:hypothetical protein
MTYTVAVLLEDRAYGGAEEGGWFYWYGEPVDLKEAPRRRFKTLEKAQGYCDKLLSVTERLNRERPSMSSVLSEGLYFPRIFSGKVKGFPDVQPHYE